MQKQEFFRILRRTNVSFVPSRATITAQIFVVIWSLLGLSAAYWLMSLKLLHHEIKICRANNLSQWFLTWSACTPWECGNQIEGVLESAPCRTRWVFCNTNVTLYYKTETFLYLLLLSCQVGIRGWVAYVVEVRAPQKNRWSKRNWVALSWIGSAWLKKRRVSSA